MGFFWIFEWWRHRLSIAWEGFPSGIMAGLARPQAEREKREPGEEGGDGDGDSERGGRRDDAIQCMYCCYCS